MELHSLALPLGYLGALLGVAMVLPQLTRTIRQPILEGVSAASWAMTSLACLAWLIYGLRADVLPQVPGNVLLIVGAVTIVFLVPSAWSRSSRAASLGSAAAAIIVMSLFVPLQAVGYVAFVISLVSVSLQLVRSYGNWRSGVESGVSLPTWWVKLAATIAWLSYSVIASDPPVLITSTIALASIIAVFGMETSARQAASRRVDEYAVA